MDAASPLYEHAMQGSCGTRHTLHYKGTYLSTTYSTGEYNHSTSIYTQTCGAILRTYAVDNNNNNNSDSLLENSVGKEAHDEERPTQHSRGAKYENMQSVS